MHILINILSYKILNIIIYIKEAPERNNTFRYHIGNILCFHFNNVIVSVLLILHKIRQQNDKKRYKFLLIISVDYVQILNIRGRYTFDIVWDYY